MENGLVPQSVRKVDARMEKLTPGTLRWQVLDALRRFRASWVELGRFLNDVAYGGDYKEWGYDDMEVYCARELGLKKPTVQKLMVSFNYMRKYESGRLESLETDPDATTTVPDYQTVELLDRVRRQEVVPPDEVDELHRRAFDGPDTDSEPEFRKELRAMLKPAAYKPDNIDVQHRELVKIITITRQLRRLLAGTDTVPEGLRERLEQSLVELEGLEG
ncbi:MAG: hypothetical protein LUC93_18320 [Planctomycetaceae bacterium]|nr:hypothetical protein [Planctomycetaceae bacterium]